MDDDARSVVSAAGAEGTVLMNWNIAEFLPPTSREVFTQIVADWIIESWQVRMSARDLRSGDARTPIKARRGGGVDDDDEAELDADTAAVLAEIGEKLMRAVPQVAKIEPGDAAKEHSSEFPVLAGSHLPMNNPALELIKTVCATLALDGHAQTDVQSVKRNLLTMIKVREFSDEAKFRDPCLTFELSDVFCNYCNAVRTLDLCRDQRLTAGDWRCPDCDNEFDKEMVEALLIEHVHQKSVAFQLQDLKCPGCGMVKNDNMSVYCGCSGEYKLKVSTRSLLTRLATLKRIATYHQFAMLEDEVDWMLAMNGHPAR